MSGQPFPGGFERIAATAWHFHSEGIPSRRSSLRHLRIVVLSCGELGTLVANRLLRTRGVRDVALVTTPYRTRKRGPLGKVRRVLRMEGWGGVGRALLRRVAPPAPASPGGPPLAVGVSHLRFGHFREAACVRAMRDLRPDLGVLAGTYILDEEVFGVPRLGCINLHCGEVPVYRGAEPGFWELYDGITRVGVTIHRVSARLDAGAVLAQEVFPLDPAPAGDPLAYLEALRRDVLIPNGMRMLAQTVTALAAGSAHETPQDESRARTRPAPDHAARRELRRRVAARRADRSRP